METCPTCGERREREGVQCPARRLCICEDRLCAECGAPAIVVEFQERIQGREPELPTSSDSVAAFYCALHSPLESEREDPPPPPIRQVPLPTGEPPTYQGRAIEQGCRVIYDDPCDSTKPKYGNKDAVQVGDEIEFIDDNTFYYRQVARIEGRSIITAPYPWNKEVFTIDFPALRRVIRRG